MYGQIYLAEQDTMQENLSTFPRKDKIPLHLLKVMSSVAALTYIPARAAVRNSMQFNGAYSCTFCEQSGETVKTGPSGHVHAYLFDEINPNGPHRALLPQLTKMQ